MIKYRSSLSARAVSKRGFTLVELLVVLAIISILISVLIPAVWVGLKTARQTAATESSHGLGELMSQYALSEGQYPDGTTSTSAFQQLLAKGYLTSANIFYLPDGGQTKFTGTSPATNLTSANVSWDIVGVNGTAGPVGMTTSAPDELPLVFSTGTQVSIPQAAGPGSATCSATGPLGTDGIAVTYRDNHSSFVKVDAGTTTVSNFIAGSFDPKGVVYVQRTP